jgi:hypothetical protein
MRIGIDFDNTIIRYDDVFASAASARALLPADFRGGKQAVRDAIRLRPDGEQDWQRLQGHVYGTGIAAARPFPGVDDFLRRARANGVRVLIVSHKTEYGHFDPDRVNLRAAALQWLQAQGFFQPDGFAALDRRDVHFAATRAEKLARIGALGCELFIDDLAEVLTDPDFPAGVARILLSDRAAEQAGQNDAGYRVCRSWQAIADMVLG